MWDMNKPNRQMHILSFKEFVGSPHTIVEGVYHTDEHGEEVFDPSRDGKYRYLLRKPINRLTKDEMLYLYAIHFTRTSWGYYYDQSKYTDFDEYVRRFKSRNTDFELDDAHEFFSGLEFPLKIYRALRDDEDIDTMCGKKSSLSWTTDINLYKSSNSQFKNCTRIVEAEITADMVQNEWTIVNYCRYSAKNRSGMTKTYPENEITLKPRYKNTRLINLKYIDKNSL